MVVFNIIKNLTKFLETLFFNDFNLKVMKSLGILAF